MSTVDSLLRQVAEALTANKSAPGPEAYQRPYLRAGHAPLNAPASRPPSLAPQLAGHAQVQQVQPGVAPLVIDQKPPMPPEPTRVDIPTVQTGNPLTGLQPAANPYVNRLDLAASNGLGLGHAVARPSGTPIRPIDSFTAPRGIGAEFRQSAARPLAGGLTRTAPGER
jgi:hypothetical protein